MTPIGKLSVATLILGSAFFTAKYLHRGSTEPPRPSQRTEVARRPLTWQARSIQEAAAPGLTEIAGVKSPSSGVPRSPAADKKPTAFNSQIAFAAFANASTTATSSGNRLAESLPQLPAPAPQRGADVAELSASAASPPTASSVLRVDPAANPLSTDPAPTERRWPIPLALSPQSDLSLVQRHEAVPAAATDEFIEYTVQFGDSLPLLASRFLGNREAYLSIYTANLDVLSSPADVAPGLVLKIPARR